MPRPAQAEPQQRIGVMCERAIVRMIGRLSGMKEGVPAPRCPGSGEMRGADMAEADVGCADAVGHAALVASLYAAFTSAISASFPPWSG
jgi:hypothetical protein